MKQIEFDSKMKVVRSNFASFVRELLYRECLIKFNWNRTPDSNDVLIIVSVYMVNTERMESKEFTELVARVKQSAINFLENEIKSKVSESLHVFLKIKLITGKDAKDQQKKSPVRNQKG